MTPEIINTSIALELAVADLYFHFHKTYPEDSGFWWKMVLEEKGHAALLRSGRDSFLPINKFPKEILDKSLHKITESLHFITNKLDEIKKYPISRKKAFELAIEVENGAGEHHFQNFMEHTQNNAINNIFQKLNGADKDHKDRILTYIEKAGL